MKMTLARKIYFSMEVGKEYNSYVLFNSIKDQYWAIRKNVKFNHAKLSDDDRPWIKALADSEKRDPNLPQHVCHDKALHAAVRQMKELGYVRWVVKTTPEHREWFPNRWVYYGRRNHLVEKAGWKTVGGDKHFYLVRTK